MGRVDGLIIPRSYNDYFSRSDPDAIRALVGQYTDDALSTTSELPVQNKVVKAAIDAKDADVDAIEALIPAQATTQNQLADKSFVNSSIGTNTANYISNNGQPFTSVAALEAYSGTVTNNDYAFVTGTDSAGNVYYDRYKATVSGASVSWAKEYRLNNSSFTAEQWAAINSGITAQIVALITNQFDIVHPVGEIYVQYPGKKSPNELWGSYSTWTEINYGGAFFRANGGKAKTWQGAKTVTAVSGTTLTFSSVSDMTVATVLYNKNTNEARYVTAVDSTNNTVTINSAFTGLAANTSLYVSQYDTNKYHRHSIPELSESTAHSHTANGNVITNGGAPDGGGDYDNTSGGHADMRYLTNASSKVSTYKWTSNNSAGNQIVNATLVKMAASNTGYNGSSSINESRPANFTIKIWERTA